jgi:hypothetical protein
MSIVMLVLIIVGFGSNSLIHFDDLPPALPIIIIHGGFMTLWFVLMLVQTYWISGKNIIAHKKLGRASLYLAAGVIITGVWVTVDHYHRLSDPVIVLLNFFAMLNFSILYILAYINRNKSMSHKRYMLLASLAMILPALGRITQVLDIEPFTTVPMWILLLLAVVLNDFVKMRQVHRSTVFGVGLIFVGIVISIALMDSQGMADFIKAMMG